MIKRVYIDTSVFGGNFDEEFSTDTIPFFGRVRLSKDASELADKYIEAKVVGKTSKADCQHIAIATVCHADVLVSWNFKHIVNLDRIRGYNGINFQNGHQMIEIRTPKEIFNYGNEE